MPSLPSPCFNPFILQIDKEVISRCSISQPVANKWGGNLSNIVYSYKYLRPFIPIKQSFARGVSGLMADSDLIFTPPNSWREMKTHCTCKHDVCTHVTPPICILLLIPSSRKVITLLASQTLPKNTQICFPCGHVLMDMKAGEKRNPSRRRGAAWVSCTFIHSRDVSDM